MWFVNFIISLKRLIHFLPFYNINYYLASLSSVSSVLSSQASIVWQDFLKLFEYFRSFDDSKSLLTNKIVVILCGLLCTGVNNLFFNIFNINNRFNLIH